LKIVPRGDPPTADQCVLSLECVQTCFMKSKMQAKVMEKTLTGPASSMKKLNYVEYLEFLCRLASATFSIDSKSAKRTSPATKKIVEISQQQFPVQLANFLSIILPALIPEEGRLEQALTIPFLDDVI